MILCICLFGLIAKVYGQLDPTFCSPPNPPNNPPFEFPIPSLLSQFEMKVEINSGLNSITMEREEYYDGQKNRGVTISRLKNVEFTSYLYGETNELFLVSGDTCRVYQANETDLSAFQTTIINGTEHIISSLANLHLKDPSVKEQYIGQTTKRGINVHEWQLCTFDSKTSATQKISYFISNPSNWTTAVSLQNFNITPVEIQIQNKLTNGTTWTDIYAISQFRPGILENNKEMFLTPRGIYCPNRVNRKIFPNFPKSFRYTSLVTIPSVKLEGYFGNSRNFFESYDYNRKIFRYDYVDLHTPYSEIHEYNYGLKYTIDKFRGHCSINLLDTTSFEATYDGTAIKLKDPQSFFDFNTTNYQYTGQRMVSGINTDVWIGVREFDNITTIWEWYFMADGWQQEGSLELEFNVPVLLSQTLYLTYFNNQTQKEDYVTQNVRSYISNFDYSGINYRDFDISKCYDDFPKKHLIFNLPTKDKNYLQNYKTNLEISLLLALELYTFVPVIRITQLQVYFNPDEIIVSFTLLEKPSFYGSVTVKPEISLVDAVTNLNNTIRANKFIIPFGIDNTTKISLVAIPESLRELEYKGNQIGDFCTPPSNPLNPPFEFPIPSLLSQFEMKVEINSGLNKLTMERDEYYDGKGNRGVTITRLKNVEFTSYLYGDTNEVFLVSGDSCNVFKANETDLSAFQITFLNGTEHIVSSLANLHIKDPNVKEVYIGPTVRRGIEVHEWQLCTYDKKLNVSQKISYFLSNPATWTSAVTLQNFNVTPIEIQIVNNASNGTYWTDIYTITQFRPGIVEDNKEIWLTPRGLYCEGRNNSKKFPDFPAAFRYSSLIVSPSLKLEGYFGNSRNIFESYDYKRKIFRYDYVENRTPYAEIHDYNTGVKYKLDKFGGKCNITKVDSEAYEATYDGTAIKLKDPVSYFDFSTTDYQYTGQRLANGINTDVWVGVRKIGNITAIWEWYFMAFGWQQESSLEIEFNVPVMLSQTLYITFTNNQTGKEDYTKQNVISHISNFDYSGVNYRDFDISRCHDDLPKRHFIFNLPTKDKAYLQQYKTNLEISLLVALEFFTYVPIIRIQQLQVYFNIGEIIVSFTLLERNSFYGQVADIKPEISLDESVTILNKIFKEDKFVIPFGIDNTTKISLKAIPDSLRELEYKSSTKKQSLSDGLIIGIGVGALIIGLVFGLAIKPIIERISRKRQTNELTMSGLFNRSYKKGQDD